MCIVADSKKKNEFFIRPVNKIIKILAHLSSFSVSLSVTLSSPQSFFLLNISPVTLSSLSLKQTSLPPPIASRRLTPHATDRLLIKSPVWSSSKPLVWSSSKPLVWSSSKPSVWSSSKPPVWSSSKLADRLTLPIASSHAADRLLIKPPVWNPWSSPTCCLFVICDFLFCLWSVNLFGLVEKKDWRYRIFFFFLL